MTLPAVVRVFFAIDPPEEVKERVGEFIGSLKKKAKSHAIRWSKPENLHITLHFLGEVETVHLPRLVENVRNNLTGKIAPVSLALGEPRLFPSPFRPRVIVLEVLAEAAALSQLAEAVGEGIVATQYAIESRAFRAHLTIGRIKQPHGLDLGFLAEAGKPNVEQMTVNEVVLFRSEPQIEGSRYTIVEKITL